MSAPKPAALVLDGVRVDLSGVRIVSGIDIAVGPGERVGLIGPNGSGKSTLLRAVYRHLRPHSGGVRYGGADLWRLPPRQAARAIAALPQENHADLELTGYEMAAMGRTPHKGPFAADTDEDRAAIGEALRRTGTEHLAGRAFAGLSGGEKQRVLLARALAQRTPLLVLDEPTNHLDVRHQFELLDLVSASGRTVLAALHDLNLAAAYCHRLYVLDGGRVTAAGTPEEVLTERLVAEVFGVHAQVVANPRTGRPHLILNPAEPSGGGAAPG
ncbi:ABC transporter ATP-binding protein [Allonocardiopsis opalescens]|uniref:Iron complex transport system ATP-binding protein n=1 Tax=Allonocardiopsis opalescens TaxID=1144618 RepID=A0A2T0QEY5_9ACTN|nr:ABC transporter ATP-binding protein [Allonocardiopsis opalescens]PRY02472.1 iron complex transport system ATP-binding protein [Allonocardiopsis opalescens]